MSNSSNGPWGVEVKSFCVLLHVSQFVGFVIPFGGFVLPLVMWLTCRDDYPEVNDHGKAVMNWVISRALYYFVGLILCVFIIGVAFLFVVWICSVVFTVIGAVKASEGKVWPYPLSIRFFSVEQ